MEAPADGLTPRGFRQWKSSGQEPFSHQSSTLEKPMDMTWETMVEQYQRNVYLKFTKKYLKNEMCFIHWL